MKSTPTQREGRPRFARSKENFSFSFHQWLFARSVDKFNFIYYVLLSLSIICKVCGKEGQWQNIKNHIEAKHIAGATRTCRICGKVSKSKNGLNLHNSKYHRKSFPGIEDEVDSQHVLRHQAEWTACLNKYEIVFNDLWQDHVPKYFLSIFLTICWWKVWDCWYFALALANSQQCNAEFLIEPNSSNQTPVLPFLTNWEKIFSFYEKVTFILRARWQ